MLQRLYHLYPTFQDSKATEKYYKKGIVYLAGLRTYGLH